MALTYLIDENLRGVLVSALVRTATRYGLTVDVVQVGDVGAPPLRTPDTDLLRWAEVENRVLVSHDRRTLSGHLAAHLAAGGHSPGILLLRQGRLADMAEHLVIAAFASDPADWQDRISFIP